MSDLKVFVRMYRKLLGDCFLVRFEQDGKSRNMLIDCGVLQGTVGGKERMRKVAKDIRRTCGETIDLIVVTHEHADHLSGFDHAHETFLAEDPSPGTTGDSDPGAGDPAPEADRQPIGIGKLWLAWTENAEDPQVESLRKRFDRQRKLVQKMALSSKAGSPFAAAPFRMLDGLAAFLGEPEAVDGRRLAAGRTSGRGRRGRRTLRDIIDGLKRRAGEENTCFLEPGQVVRLPFDPGLRVFVLGPPRDPELLFKDRSSGSSRETYLDRLDPAHELIEVAAGLAEEPPRSDRSPFARPYRELTVESVETLQKDGDLRLEALRHWFNAHYFAHTRCRHGARPPEGHKCDHDPECREDQGRRRIDSDWMASGAELALKLDSDTNNTSLVLAIELPDGTFLLFTGDAQAGNWLSWHRQTYSDPAPTAGLEPVLTAEQILNRTRLYKVGHHGSHNATLSRQGLEMMTRPDLVAMVSTDEEFARTQGRYGWKMPDPKVRAAIIAATRGRLIRGDLHRSEETGLGSYPALPDFLDRLDEKNGKKLRDLYVEYRVFG